MIELDEQLREAGERWRAAERVPIADFARATAAPRRSRSPRRSRLLVVAAVAAVVATLVAAAVLAFGGGDSSPQKVVVTQPTTPTSAPPAPPSQLTLDPRIIQIQALAIDGASVWVTGDAPESRAATLEHIDTETGKVIGTVVLGDNGPFQILVGDNAIWVCSQQNEKSAHLTKVDPKTGKITAVIETAGDAAVASTPGALWVDVNSGELQRRNSETSALLATIALPGAGYSAHFITAGSLGIFLANPYDGTILRVDPATNTVEQIADVGDHAEQIVELDGSLWINADSALVEMDPVSGAVRRRINRSVRELATDGRSLWATTSGPNVLRIDPHTAQVTPVALLPGVPFALDLAADPTTGAVWASAAPHSAEVQPLHLLRISP
jgi:hypothetical protein